MKPSRCPGLYFWRALTCVLALLLLLLQFTTLSLLTASTSVLLISHAGSHGKGFCKALKVTVAKRCRRWVGCPEVLCEVDHGETIHHKRKGATPSRTFVLLLRDPRDVVTSLHKKGHQSCSSRFDCSVQRIRSVANWTEAQHREYSNQPEAFILFFEEAASDLHETLHSLAGLLGMDLSSATDEESGAWRNATKHGKICQTRSEYPAWIGSYVSTVMREELSQDLWNRWASCNVTWTPAPCHHQAVLEVHEGLHGDVCRWPGGGQTCPVPCRDSQDMPDMRRCVMGNESCRAAHIEDRWRDQFVPNTLTPRVMHTFYEPTTNDAREHPRKQTLASWEYHWRRAGWHTRVLGLDDAKKSAFYKQLLVRLNRIPLGPNPAYEKMCYLRYLAMAEAGGGWMSDYDTLPMQLLATSGLMDKGRFTVLQGHVPALMSGSQEEWRRMSVLLTESAILMTRQTPMPRLVSDMHAMAGLVNKSGLKNKSFDALTSYNWVADATTYVRPDSECGDFRSFHLAIHVSHASLTEGLGLPMEEVEARRPTIMKETMERFWSCIG
ncbi:sirt2 [Symbiodinium sp. CCMP2592]|nr:sirt2 [Symbiodinium sp. CCMP2592]